MASRLGIHGRDGLSLADAWADENPTAYLGMTVECFPNFFTMIGPNSGPAHGGSVVFQAECQTRYITSLIVQMVEKGFNAFEVKSDVLRQFVEEVDAEHEKLIWTHPGVDTYYKNRHGRVTSGIPWRFVDYWKMTHDAQLSDYEFEQEGNRSQTNDNSSVA
jgi:4-hydroxyacetophenone monooxygenase